MPQLALYTGPQRFMDGAAYRDSLRQYSPRVFVDGRAVESVADDPAFVPSGGVPGSVGEQAPGEGAVRLEPRNGPAFGTIDSQTRGG